MIWPGWAVPGGPLLGVTDAPALASTVVSLKLPLAAGSLLICVAVASDAVLMTYVPGVATEPAMLDAEIAELFDDVGVVALKFAGSLIAANVSWNFATRSWILSSSACWLLRSVTLVLSGVSCASVRSV